MNAARNIALCWIAVRVAVHHRHCRILWLISLAYATVDYDSPLLLVLPPRISTMSSLDKGKIQAAIAVCGKSTERTSYLDGAFHTALGKVEDAPTVVAVLPEYFHTNDAYRKLFALVLAEQFRFRS